MSSSARDAIATVRQMHRE